MVKGVQRLLAHSIAFDPRFDLDDTGLNPCMQATVAQSYNSLDLAD